MDNFIVSARKYRPATFDMVVGQKSITTTLKNAIKNNHLAQAFLFCGPRGVGKTTCARILAKTINCQNLTENLEPCDQCESCVSFNQSATFNIFELDAASNNSVDDIRTLVDQVRIPPQTGKYKVYIIDEVHMLSSSAFNAFLKTLEEPPAYAKFILATTEKHKIIPTILSRCQIFDFRRITIEDTVKYLEYVAQKEGVNTTVDALQVIARKAEGAMRDALSIFDQMVSLAGNNLTYKDVIENLNVLDVEYYFQLTNCFLHCDIQQLLTMINEVIENGFEEHQFVLGIGEHLRNVLLCKDAGTAEMLDISDETKDKLLKQAKACSQDFLFKSLDIINKCDINFKASNNRRLFIELSLIQMALLNDNRPKEIVESAPSIANTRPATETKKISATAAPVKSAISEATPNYKTPEKKTETGNEKAQSSISLNANLKGIKRISIKDSLKEDTVVPTETPTSQDVIETANEETATAFTQAQFLSTWTNYAESIAKEHPGLSSTLLKHDPEVDEDFVATFEINNLSQEDEINLKKSEILEYLKKNLNNYKIQLLIKLNEIKEDNLAYTPQDKYNKMKETNPDLEDFRTQLNLKLES